LESTEGFIGSYLILGGGWWPRERRFSEDLVHHVLKPSNNLFLTIPLHSRFAPAYADRAMRSVGIIICYHRNL
jgi:hypothetical protein